MQGIKEFIVHVDKAFNDEVDFGKMKLFVDKRISRDRASNRYGTIVSSPIFSNEDSIPAGTEVVFDATILYEQIYKEGVQESIFLVDKENSYYRVEPSLIILYRANKNEEWKGYKNNLMVELIKEIQPEKTGSIFIPTTTSKTLKNKAKIIYTNEELLEMGVYPGDEVFIRPDYVIPFYFKEKTLQWIRTNDVLAK